jgi:hypothetical protein
VVYLGWGMQERQKKRQSADPNKKLLVIFDPSSCKSFCLQNLTSFLNLRLIFHFYDGMMISRGELFTQKENVSYFLFPNEKYEVTSNGYEGCMLKALLKSFYHDNG